MAARLRPGILLPSGRITGETDRIVHLFPLPLGAARPDRLTSLCGELVITPGIAEVLTRLGGMPCAACLALATGVASG
ncbi:hypothetical protein BAY60_35910 (plasmid) [Prauserella muralis]|uniref:Uncharacterized protein n=1 Tax=Prauserella muralis TaxID=588067 RepID=A0A2V4AC39_9PSEU|nr:hypothetical protein BAY60_35910 [Prauserella muralis]